MKEKRPIDWETFWDIEPCNALCDDCKHNYTCNSSTEHNDCPIWASLEDAGDSDLRAKIFEFINNWEPRESGHHGVLWYACQELRGFIGEPGCNCDECNYPEKDPESEKRKAERRTKPFLMSRKGGRQ